MTGLPRALSIAPESWRAAAAEAYYSALLEGWTANMNDRQVKHTVIDQAAADNRPLHESEIMEAPREPFAGLQRIHPQVIRDTPAEILDAVILNGRRFAIVTNTPEPYATGQTTKYHAVILPAEEYRRLVIDRDRLSRAAGELLAISNGQS